MKITFIFHSSFLIECEKSYLLFDYYQGELPALDPEKPLYALASHQHYDHFSPGIFQLVKKYPRCTFLLSDDIPEKLVSEAMQELGESPKILWMREGSRMVLDPETGGHEILSEGEAFPEADPGSVRVTGFPSTDQGLSYLVETEGRRIFHAGDLNDWWWPNEWKSRNESMQADYFRILDSLKETLGKDPLDVVFHPMDPVLGVGEYRGPVEFLERIAVRHFFPMHMWERYSVGTKFLEAYPEYEEVFRPISGAGQEFTV